MKFLAILKDSFREAADSKALYVMLALSLVIVLVVGSISFHPASGAEALPEIVARFGWENGMQEKQRDGGGFRHAVVSNLRQLDQTTPFRGEYQFALNGFWVEPAGAPAPRERIDASAAAAESYLRTQFERHDFEVLEIRPVADKFGGGHFTFEVRVRGVGSGRAWPHEAAYFFGAWQPKSKMNLGLFVYIVEDFLIDGIGGWLAILVSVIITAFFIPNMLNKGAVDLLLAKPIGRCALLISKYIGGLTFMFINSAVAVGGIWLVMGLRSGLWAPGFLLSGLALTACFALLYSISTLIAVLTRSVVVSILVSLMAWFLFMAIGRAYFSLPQLRILYPEMPQWYDSAVNFLHAVTPRMRDLDMGIAGLLSRSVLSEAEIRWNMLDKLPEVNWAASLGVTGAYTAAFLTLACWRFSKRDY